ncbi:longitudinals lacking protein, isoforms H/M/V isoform X3 [Hyalella azteca]|uniref:Longitudinals lacking protein, isoforms H/M/V isoform X3 n=1 Tax=Hyalella azteca TaxID=294128 RepID=A0A979FTH0_HYAAZ|nr:longitudinals lacking protein, isoforms H/M/V isoform X3 [Hyalella azteca]
MAELLSLKWNNHKSTFFHVLSTIRAKESYSDVTLACDGRFYSLHKFVLSTCSEYFEEMFERTQCKHPVIVLKDINSEDLEALLNYMYVGEVNVVQEKLAGLIKAAECLKIKGLAVPDEDPMESKDNSSIGREQHKRSQRGEDSPRAKRRRRENSSDVSEEILSPVRSRPSGRSRDHHHHHHHHGSHNAESAPVAPSGDNEDGTRETQGLTDASEEAENSPSNAKRRADTSSNKASSTQTNEEKARKQEAIPEENVKAEPVDSEADGDDCTEVPGELEDKTSLHQALGLDVDDESEFIEDTSLLEPPQTMEEVVAEVIPGSAEYQANSFLWEGDGSLSGLPTDSFTSDSSHPRQIGGDQDENLVEGEMTEEELVGNAAAMITSTLLEAKEACDMVAEVAAASTIRAHIILNEDVINSLFEEDNTNKHAVYRCRICLYTSLKKNNIENHVITHTDLQAFKCQLCPYKSNFKKDLVDHCNLNHQVTSAS